MALALSSDRWADVECSENAAQGEQVSILKEIFPDHGKEPTPCVAPASGKLLNDLPGCRNDSILEQLLGTIATPSRARNQAAPCPPVHAPTLPPSMPPSMPPTMPPSMPAPVWQAAAAQWEAPRLGVSAPSDTGFGSYRERLRAGGRGAFQRSIDAGLIPKTMKQDHHAMQEWSAAPEQAYQQQMHYDGQQTWNGMGQMQGYDYWSSPMNQPQMAAPYMQQQMEVQPAMTQQMMPPMLPISQADQPMQMLQMPQMPTPTSSDSSPSDCMAMVMPGTEQFSNDKDIMAAQLRAVASCQIYED